jgi:hypothetical protein
MPFSTWIEFGDLCFDAFQIGDLILMTINSTNILTFPIRVFSFPA